jgi:GcrA cell cycle regulator
MSGWWSDERIDFLKKMWADGLSASQIYRRLGAVSRSAVIGKLHRLGLPGRAKRQLFSNPHKNRPRKLVRKPRAYPKVVTRFGRSSARLWDDLGPAEPLPAVEEIVIPEKERKQLVDLEQNDCRWPIGDPKQAGFHFCGRRKVAGLSYCMDHARRAYQPPNTPPRTWLKRVRVHEVA